MTDERFHEICASMPADVIDCDEVGWEEMTNAAVVDLLRGSLAQSAQDRGMVPTLNTAMMQCDSLKLNLKQAIDRILSEKPAATAM